MKNINEEYNTLIKLIRILTDLALAYKGYSESLEKELDKFDHENESFQEY